MKWYVKDGRVIPTSSKDGSAFSCCSQCGSFDSVMVEAAACANPKLEQKQAFSKGLTNIGSVVPTVKLPEYTDNLSKALRARICCFHRLI